MIAFASVDSIVARFDVMVCRHVVEHVPCIMDFLKDMRAVATKAGIRVAMFETPRFDWIYEHNAFGTSTTSIATTSTRMSWRFCASLPASRY